MGNKIFFINSFPSISIKILLCNFSVKKPRMLSFEDAAAGIGDCVRAYTALHYQAQVCAGDTVLVLDGASSFGSATVQLARQWGAKVRSFIANTQKM